MVSVQRAKDLQRGPVAPRRGAIGKAFIVWLASGSVGLAIVAFIIFVAMGC